MYVNTGMHFDWCRAEDSPVYYPTMNELLLSERYISVVKS